MGKYDAIHKTVKIAYRLWALQRRQRRT